jgi:RNA polymerase sigma-70 factor, ECF subfamily
METPQEICLPNYEAGQRSISSCQLVDSAVEDLIIILFDQFHGRLCSYVLAFGLSIHDAEDIVQETFLSLVGHLNARRDSSKINSWLFRVAHNLALKKRTANKMSMERRDHEVSISQMPDHSYSAERQVIDRQSRTQLRAVFAVLPELDQRCLHLRAEGMKYREIARILGISLGAVSISLTRSLARMSRVNGGE